MYVIDIIAIYLGDNHVSQIALMALLTGALLSGASKQSLKHYDTHMQFSMTFLGT
jgi:hypothetical protein